MIEIMMLENQSVVSQKSDFESRDKSSVESFLLITSSKNMKLCAWKNLPVVTLKTNKISYLMVETLTEGMHASVSEVKEFENR